MRLSVTIPAALLVHVGAHLAHTDTNWLLAFEIFLIAGLAMIHNDYYDRENDIKKGKTFAYEHPQEFRRVLIIGWLVVWILALTFLLLQYWVTLLPVIVISICYSYFRKIIYLQTLCVALTSASPLIIGHIDDSQKDPMHLNIIFFFVVLLSIYAREVIKDIEDRNTDKGWKNTPVSKGREPLHEYIEVAGSLMCICTMILVAVFKQISEHASPVASLFLMLAIGCCGGVLSWQNPDFLPGVPRYRERSDTEVEIDLATGKKWFYGAMFCLIVGLSFV